MSEISSPKPRSKRGVSAWMSIKVSFLPKPTTEGFVSFHRAQVGMPGRTFQRSFLAG
jgi:hypothetical protein